MWSTDQYHSNTLYTFHSSTYHSLSNLHVPYSFVSWCTLVTACTDMLIEPALQHSINAPACSNASLSPQFLPSYRWSRDPCCRTQELMLSPFRIDEIALVFNQSRRVSARSAGLHFHFRRDYRERQNTHWIHKRGNTPRSHFHAYSRFIFRGE